MQVHHSRCILDDYCTFGYLATEGLFLGPSWSQDQPQTESLDSLSSIFSTGMVLHIENLKHNHVFETPIKFGKVVGD